MCIDHESIFGFRRNLAFDCELLVRSEFFVVSVISVFASYFINLTGALCGRPHPPGPHGGGGGGGGPHGSGGPAPPGPTAAASIPHTHNIHKYIHMSRDVYVDLFLIRGHRRRRRRGARGVGPPEP